MSLREELPPKDQPISFTTVRHDANKELADQVAAFVANGGKVEVIPIGVTKDSILFNRAPDNKKQAEIHEGFADKPKNNRVDMVKKEIRDENKNLRSKPTMRPERRAKSGHMNIHTLPNGKHVVCIKSMHVGTFDPDRMQDAITARDVERAKLGLPMAEY